MNNVSPIAVPTRVRELLGQLLEVLPIERAMPNLVPKSPVGADALAAALAVSETLKSPELRAGLWLYVDDLDRSHTISQSIETSLGAYWHGIMHRREGDFSNSKYWFRRADTPPFSLAGYDPLEFVDRVAAARGQDPDDLVDMQRREWVALFAYCAAQAAQEELK